MKMGRSGFRLGTPNFLFTDEVLTVIGQVRQIGSDFDALAPDQPPHKGRQLRGKRRIELCFQFGQREPGSDPARP